MLFNIDVLNCLPLFPKLRRCNRWLCCMICNKYHNILIGTHAVCCSEILVNIENTCSDPLCGFQEFSATVVHACSRTVRWSSNDSNDSNERVIEIMTRCTGADNNVHSSLRSSTPNTISSQMHTTQLHVAASKRPTEPRKRSQRECLLVFTMTKRNEISYWATRDTKRPQT